MRSHPERKGFNATQHVRRSRRGGPSQMQDAHVCRRLAKYDGDGALSDRIQSI